MKAIVVFFIYDNRPRKKIYKYPHGKGYSKQRLNIDRCRRLYEFEVIGVVKILTRNRTADFFKTVKWKNVVEAAASRNLTIICGDVFLALKRLSEAEVSLFLKEVEALEVELIDAKTKIRINQSNQETVLKRLAIEEQLADDRRIVQRLSAELRLDKDKEQFELDKRKGIIAKEYQIKHYARKTLVLLDGFKDADSNLNNRELADKLNSQGQVTYHLKAWTRNSVWRLLRNREYYESPSEFEELKRKEDEKS